MYTWHSTKDIATDTDGASWELPGYLYATW